MVAKLLKFVPAHHTYVEVFGGGASLLMRKKPAPVEVYNDIHSGLVNLFRLLSNPEQFEEFHRQVSLIPYSREEFHACGASWESITDPVLKAVAFFVRQRQGFSGTRGWSYAVTGSSRGMADPTSKWLSTIDVLPEIHARLFRCQIEHDDFRKLIPRYDTPETLFYCDPPYVLSTRRSVGYDHELTDADHKELISMLLGVKGMVLLSGYNSPLYGPLEQAGWTREDIKVACSAAPRTKQSGLKGTGSLLAKQPRTESLWLSPALCDALDKLKVA